jgi:excisionase family DNA binding protein
MDRLLTVKDVSRSLGLHSNTVYKLAQKGDIPYVKIHRRRLRFRKDDLDEWIARGSYKPSVFLESLTKVDLGLQAYDRLFLCKKGGVNTMSPKGPWSYPFGSVFLRQTKKSGDRFYIYYRFEGKRIREAVRGAQSRADALKVLQMKIADAFRGKHGFKKDEKKITFADFCDLYIKNYAKVNKRSWKDDVYSTRILKSIFKGRSLHEIDSFAIEELKTKRLDEGISKARVNRNLALLKKMFNLAIDWGYTKENPVRRVRFFSEKDNLKERILTEAEEIRLLKTCADHLKPIVLTALHTGMRRGEILGLEWRQVDLVKRLIKVEKTKSGRSRAIPIDDLLRAELMKLKTKNGSTPSCQNVFLNPRTSKPISDVKTAFSAALRRAGIKGLRFHDLRHTFASRLIERGIDLITVKELLGHHSVVITQRYTHPSIEQKKRAVESLVSRPGILPDSVPGMSPRMEGETVFDLLSRN